MSNGLVERCGPGACVGVATGGGDGFAQAKSAETKLLMTTARVERRDTNSSEHSCLSSCDLNTAANGTRTPLVVARGTAVAESGDVEERTDGSEKGREATGRRETQIEEGAASQVQKQAGLHEDCRAGGSVNPHEQRAQAAL